MENKDPQDNVLDLNKIKNIDNITFCLVDSSIFTPEEKTSFFHIIDNVVFSEYLNMNRTRYTDKIKEKIPESAEIIDIYTEKNNNSIHENFGLNIPTGVSVFYCFSFKNISTVPSEYVLKILYNNL